MKHLEVLALVGVGALWGCTNPLIREGSKKAESNEMKKENTRDESILSSLSKFQNIHVWLPYAVNQLGSLLYYFALSESDLSLAVPICNGLALVFSIITSFFIVNEEIEKPRNAVFGSFLILVGVAVCLDSRS